MRVGILTAGGDCPGLNAVIRASTRLLLAGGHEAVGLLRGYEGLADPEQRMPLTEETVRGILQLGGTILQSASFDPYMEPQGMERVRAAQARDRLDGIIAIGGEHTQWISRRLSDDGFPVVGVPKTIDNDVIGTDRTFGFDTAVQTATDALDKLRTTAQSHHRVIVCEVMGRNSGWIAVHAGLAGGADEILVPELDRTVADVAATLVRRHERGASHSIVVVAEGAKFEVQPGDGAIVLASDSRDAYGYERLGGIGAFLGAELERETGYDTRVTVLGHLQRGGSPVATDRILATRFGLHAAELVMEGTFGRMVALHGELIDSVPFSATEGAKTIDRALLEAAAVFF